LKAAGALHQRLVYSMSDAFANWYKTGLFGCAILHSYGAAVNECGFLCLLFYEQETILTTREGGAMGSVIAGFTMSLDGFIADANDDIAQLFRWYFGGDVEVPVPYTTMTFKLSKPSAAVLQERFRTTGAIVTGRRDFDVSRAWGGKPPLEVPIFILTHTPPEEWLNEGSPFIFVTDGIERAVAQAKAAAGEKHTAIGSSTTTQQCLKAGLLDEIHIDLAPVLLGAGVPLFAHLGIEPVQLETIQVIDAPGVTHLKFRVRK
jgi:dihydrofolate reductase